MRSPQSASSRARCGGYEGVASSDNHTDSRACWAAANSLIEVGAVTPPILTGAVVEISRLRTFGTVT